ncbi:MAG: cell division protein FtsZ [Cardiobacteriaceae bacterium]|nr:cell division protein FtsZ [Cardiobacteriaceae bacterium]
MIDFDNGTTQQISVKKIKTNANSNIQLKVIGLGGGGSNAVDKMLQEMRKLRDKQRDARTDEESKKYNWLDNIELIVANTDEQALDNSEVEQKIQLGPKCAEGLGAGSDPMLGEEAAEESQEDIAQAIDGARLLFIAACMGGGTGTGSAPVVARIAREAREKKINTLAVVSKPFESEGEQRMEQAEAGIRKLREEVDCLVVIPNENVKRLAGEGMLARQAYQLVDQTLSDAVLNIAALVYQTGYINADLRDLLNAMKFNGIAMVGYGEGSGKNRAQEAIDNALSSPLLENIELSTAKSILFGIWASDLKHDEENLIISTVNKLAKSSDVKRKHGLYDDPTMEDRLRVFLFATGLDQEQSHYVSPSDEPNKPNHKAWDIPDFA